MSAIDHMSIDWLKRPRYTPQQVIRTDCDGVENFRPNPQVRALFLAWVSDHGGGDERKGDVEQLKLGMPAFDPDTWVHLAQLLGWRSDQIGGIDGASLAPTHPVLRARHPRHAIQPLAVDRQEVIRFMANQAVDHMLENGKLNMNDLALRGDDDADREQLAQLIGYSHSGFGTLAVVSDEVFDAAWEEFEQRPVALEAALMEAATPSCTGANKGMPRL